MKTRIIETGRGQTPYTIKEAWQKINGLTKYSAEKWMRKNSIDQYTFAPGKDFQLSAGYDFRIECTINL